MSSNPSGLTISEAVISEILSMHSDLKNHVPVYMRKQIDSIDVLLRSPRTWEGFLLSIDEVLEVVRDAIEDAGNQQKFAIMAGVSQPYLSDVMHCHRPPGEKILNYMGLKKITTYFLTSATLSTER